MRKNMKSPYKKYIIVAIGSNRNLYALLSYNVLEKLAVELYLTNKTSLA